MSKRYFPDSVGTDSVPTATQSSGTLILPKPATRVRKEKVVCFLTNPSADITTIDATGESQTEVTLVCTSNSGNKKLTDGSNLKLSADFTPGAGDTLELICDGTNFYETGRSNN